MLVLLNTPSPGPLPLVLSLFLSSPGNSAHLKTTQGIWSMSLPEASGSCVISKCTGHPCSWASQNRVAKSGLLIFSSRACFALTEAAYHLAYIHYRPEGTVGSAAPSYLQLSQVDSSSEACYRCLSFPRFKLPLLV